MYSQQALACCVGVTSMERFAMLEALAKLSKSLATCMDLWGVFCAVSQASSLLEHVSVQVAVWPIMQAVWQSIQYSWCLYVPPCVLCSC